MGVTGSPFCEHKKLRTSCAICKPAALPSDAALRAVPFVTQEERERLAAKRERRTDAGRESAAGGGGGTPPSDTEAQPKLARPTGPGKPLLPQRKRTNRNISAAEADSVKPWWVKK